MLRKKRLLKCRNCDQLVQQVAGKRNKLYCSARCKKQYQRSQKKEVSLLPSVNRDTPKRDKYRQVEVMPKSIKCPSCNNLIVGHDGKDYSGMLGRQFFCSCNWNSFISIDNQDFILLDWSLDNDK